VQPSLGEHSESAMQVSAARWHANAVTPQPLVSVLKQSALPQSKSTVHFA
jgi:hypothetical protein